MESWPSILPSPNANFSSAVASSVARSTMDSGYVRQRPRFTQQMRTINAKWAMDDDEYAIFQAWWKYKISSGADWFTISLPLGDGFKTYTCRFVGDYSASAKPVLYHEVSAKLECLVGSPLTEAELDALLE